MDPQRIITNFAVLLSLTEPFNAFQLTDLTLWATTLLLSSTALPAAGMIPDQLPSCQYCHLGFIGPVWKLPDLSNCVFTSG